MRGDAFIHFVCGSRWVNIRLGVLLLIPKSPQLSVIEGFSFGTDNKSSPTSSYKKGVFFQFYISKYCKKLKSNKYSVKRGKYGIHPGSWLTKLPRVEFFIQK